MNDHLLIFPRNYSGSVPTKTASGKNYQQIQSELIKPLPPSVHQIKKLGYSKDLKCDTYYGFVSYSALRDRLSEIVGSEGWRLHIDTYHLNGEGVPVMTGTLNILGVEKQGFGYGRSHDSYKGERDEIAYADCFKNAAEAHGLGAYLNNQEGLVLYLVGSSRSPWESTEGKDPATQAKGRQLGIQFQKQNKLLLQEPKQEPKQQATTTTTAKPTAATTKQPTTATTATKTQEFLYPKHNEVMKGIRTRIGLNPDNILKLSNGVLPGNLAPDQFKDLLITAIADWSVVAGHYTFASNARSAISGAIAISTKGGLSLEQAVHQWLDNLLADTVLTPP